MNRTIPLLSMLVFLATLPRLAFPQNQWQQNNGPYGGFVADITGHSILHAVSPHLYFRSIDNGATWISHNLPIATSAQSPHCLLAINSNRIIVDGFVSNDAGETWQPNFSYINIDAAVAMDDGNLYAINYINLYRSTDQGGTWQNVNPDWMTTPLALAKGSDGSLLIGVNRVNINGVMKTTDNCSTWTPIAISDSIRVGAIGSTTNGAIYVGAIEWSASGVYRTTNEGQSWSRIGTLDWWICDLLAMNDGAVYVTGTSRSGIVGGIARYPANGSQWEVVLTDSSDNFDRIFHHEQSGLYFATSHRNGVWSSISGSNWAVTGNTGIHATTVKSVVFGSATESYAVAWDRIYRRENEQSNWNGFSNFHDYTVSFTIGSNNRMFAGCGHGDDYSGYFLSSMNQGASWDTVWNNQAPLLLQTAPNGNLYGVVHVDSLNGWYEVRQSTDNGTTWRTVFLCTDYIYCVDFAPNPSEHHPEVYIGTIRGIYETYYDNRYTYGPTLSAHGIRSVTFLPNSVGFAATDSGLFVSNRSVSYWEPFAHSAAPLYSVIVSSQNDVYAAGCGFVYRIHWPTEVVDSLCTGLPSAAVTQLKIDPRTGYLYAGTDGAGVYRSSLPVVGIEDWSSLTFVPATVTLSQNYPNPFNSSTTISYSLPTATDIEISIFDIQGRTVERLVQGNVPAGAHTTQWHAQRYPSGTYFYRLQTKHSSTIQPMELLK